MIINFYKLNKKINLKYDILVWLFVLYINKYYLSSFVRAIIGFSNIVLKVGLPLVIKFSLLSIWVPPILFNLQLYS